MFRLIYEIIFGFKNFINKSNRDYIKLAIYNKINVLNIRLRFDYSFYLGKIKLYNKSKYKNINR